MAPVVPFKAMRQFCAKLMENYKKPPLSRHFIVSLNDYCQKQT